MYKIAKTVILCISVILILSLSSCEQQDDNDLVYYDLVYYDNLGYLLHQDGDYLLLDVSKYTEEVLVVPSTLPDGRIVTIVNGKSENITTLILPDTVVAATWDSPLKTLHIGARLRNITGVDDYKHCIEKLTVSENNPYFYSENNCFIEKETRLLVFGCNNGIIPDGVITIGRLAFADTNISEVHIPDSVKTIEYSAFAYCASLESVYIGKNVETILDCAFYATPQLIINCAAESKPEGWSDEWVAINKGPTNLGCKELNWGVERE